MFGLTPDETSAYRELIAVPSASAAELAGRLRLAVAETRALLTTLERRGLASHDSQDLARFVAAPPAAALGALLAEQRIEIKRAELQIDALQEVYQAASARRGISGLLDVVQGQRQVAERFRLLQMGAEREVLAFVKAPATAVSARENTAAEQAALARGVRYRVVAERAALEEQGGIQAALATIPEGERMRLVGEVPLKLIIVDRRAAFLPIVATPGPDGAGAVVVHESALLDALLALFEAEWMRATPIRTPGHGQDDPAAARNGTPLDETDARLLELLLAGYTDDAVAKQLGISLRTVQRRISGLMGLAGVQTRMQLGWHAATQGWLGLASG
ncbi:helix-turn-helix domain-containing protein [Actinomadura harenae]|uniref:helix-turn-helix domain-containing protein n=1 Tax=Actinomadura harenae TaxID=2483351 RepID=UPI0018F55F66|nr:helix-turn-helix domain-containing protein [Actinomadura harenae]